MKVPELPPRNPRKVYLLSIPTKREDNLPIERELLGVSVLLCYGKHANDFGMAYCAENSVEYIEVPKHGFGIKECVSVLTFGLIIARIKRSSLTIVTGEDRGSRRLNRVATANHVRVITV